MLRSIDAKIDSITMYRLILYYLVGLLIAAIGLSIIGDMHYHPIAIVASALMLVGASYVYNLVLAAIFDAPINGESSIITGLILSLIIAPDPSGTGFLFLLAAPGLAMASKYILAIGKKHIFNPAAIAVVLTAYGPHQSANWWIGSAPMFPFVLIGGLILARKIRRGKMILAFFITTFIATIVFSLLSKASPFTGVSNMVLSSAALFLGFVMLTEPLTSPVATDKQLWYAGLVGVLLPPQVHIFNLYSSPEIALVAGNIYAYLVSPKTKLFPVIKKKIQIAADTFDFVFNPGAKLQYEPGQYIELTLPHQKTDARGSRRYFTLASSPTEPDIRIGVKFNKQGSSFKRALAGIDQSTSIVATQVAGEFILPKDTTRKLAFIAGGIGVTPFRSMVKYLNDRDELRSITMLYAARTHADVAYQEVFAEARERIGMKTVYVYSNDTVIPTETNALVGHISAEIITREIPDFRERLFYLSGTHSMVETTNDILIKLGVSPTDIKIDFFPGYV